MPDLIARGDAWFETKRRERLSVAATYRVQGAGAGVVCRATVVVGQWDSVDRQGNVVRFETRDFFVPVEQVPAAPLRGDTITCDGSTYTVLVPEGGTATWRWADRSEKLRRVHTIRTGAAAGGGATDYSDDTIAQGEAWFEQQRRAHLSVAAEYRAKHAFLPIECDVTMVVGKWDSVDRAGSIVRSETRDFFLAVSDVAADPVRGDVIAVTTDDDVEQLYTVTIPAGSSQAWRWADRRQTVRRVHTMRMPSAAPVPVGGVFVPGVFVEGVFA